MIQSSLVLPCSSGSLCASFKEVEHPCQQCGTAVEDGRPFCPQCRAPQISVKVAIPETAVAPGLSSTGDAFSSEIPAGASLASFQTLPGATVGTMDRSIAARSAIKAGVLGFFIGMLVPFLAIVVAGGLAVFFYRRESGFVLPVALASRAGGAAGVVAVAIQSFFFAIWIFVFHRQKEYIDSVTRFVHSVGADASIPDIQASIRTMFTPAGMIITLVLAMIVAMVLASIGGALASLLLRPRNPRP
jgi:hypothetical protein